MMVAKPQGLVCNAVHPAAVRWIRSVAKSQGLVCNYLLTSHPGERPELLQSLKGWSVTTMTLNIVQSYESLQILKGWSVTISLAYPIRYAAVLQILKGWSVTHLNPQCGADHAVANPQGLVCNADELSVVLRSLVLQILKGWSVTGESNQAGLESGPLQILKGWSVTMPKYPV